MRFGLPTKSVLGQLTLEGVYEYYDGPRLFLCRNRTDQLFLCLSIIEEPNRDGWLYVAISRERLASIEDGRLDIRTAFAAPENDQAFLVERTRSSETFDVAILDSSNVTDEQLPADDAFYLAPGNYEQPVVSLTSQLESVDRVAQQRHRETVRVELRFPDLPPSEAPTRALGAALSGFQELITALAQAVKGEATTRGRIPPDILQASELRVVNTYAASFGVEMSAAQIGDLFGGSVASDALDAVNQLFAAGPLGDQLGTLLTEYKPRVASKYRHFVQSLVDEQVGFTFDWGSPAPDRGGRHDLSRDILRQIATTIALIDKSSTRQYDLRGTLIGFNARTRTFELEDLISKERVRGRLAPEGFTEGQEYTIHRVYLATIRETVEVTGLTGEETYSCVLVALTSVD